MAIESFLTRVADAIVSSSSLAYGQEHDDCCYLPSGSSMSNYYNSYVVRPAQEFMKEEKVASNTKQCLYCHGITPNDSRGHCIACGAPRGT